MKVLLYFEGQHMIRRSGIGHAMRHQMAALDSQGIEWTLNEKDDYDILHLNTVGIASEMIAKKARREGKKILVHAHSTQEDFRNSFLLSNQVSALFKKRLMHVYQLGDRIVTPTPYSKRLLEEYGITIPIDAVSNGVDLERFARDERKIAAYRDHFHLEGKKSVICVGLPFERKGIFDFIEVARQLPEVTFIWFGKVPLYTVPAKIRRIVKGAHPPNVIFPGYVEGDVLEGAYAGADAFFFPSKEETEGIVVLEALAASQQIIVRDIPVFSDWLTHGVNCWKGKDTDEFRALVSAAVNHKLKDIRAGALQCAQERSIEAVGRSLHRVYEKLYE